MNDGSLIPSLGLITMADRKKELKEHSPSAAHSLTWTHPGENMLHMISEQSEKPILFDVAWEVCRCAFDAFAAAGPIPHISLPANR